MEKTITVSKWREVSSLDDCLESISNGCPVLLIDQQETAISFGLEKWEKAIDIQKFLPLPLFQQNMDEYIRQVKNGPKKEGTSEILIPGEIESRKRRERLQKGIPFSLNVEDELSQLCAAYGLDLKAARIAP